MYSVHVYVCNHLYLIHTIYMLCFILFSVHSFVELVQYLFSLPDVSLFLSNRLCQVPLEKFFGEQRQRGRVNENPNVEFLRNTQALRVINTTCANVKAGFSLNRRSVAGRHASLSSRPPSAILQFNHGYVGVKKFPFTVRTTGRVKPCRSWSGLIAVLVRFQTILYARAYARSIVAIHARNSLHARNSRNRML